jgi:hypothetical protein
VNSAFAIELKEVAKLSASPLQSESLMTEPDCVTCLNHVVDVHNLIFEAEGPGEWGKGIVVIADIEYLVLDLQKTNQNQLSSSYCSKKLTIEFVSLYTVF